MYYHLWILNILSMDLWLTTFEGHDIVQVLTKAALMKALSKREISFRNY